MKYVTVDSHRDRYCSFPSIACLSGNRVLVAFREAGKWSADAARAAHATHHDLDSRIVLIESDDGGVSFNPATRRVVLEADNRGVNDPALTVLKSGDLLLRACRLEVCPSRDRASLQSLLTAHRPDLGTVSGCAGQCIQRSRDGGKTWTEPQTIEAGTLTAAFSREPVVELEDGVLLLSVYRSVPTESERVYVLRSWDNGASWGDPALVVEDPRGAHSMIQGTNFNETALLPLGGGRILAMIRSDSSYCTGGEHVPVGGVGELVVAFSENAGLSWSAASPSGVWGQPAHLLRLRSGAILCTYGYRRPPYGVRCVLSYDDGMTWDVARMITLKEDCPTWDLGYPSSIELADGMVVTVYYWTDREGTRYIEAVRWRPQEAT